MKEGCLKVADLSRVASERGVSITGLPQRGSLDVLQTEKAPKKKKTTRKTEVQVAHKNSTRSCTMGSSTNPKPAHGLGFRV